MKKIELTQGKSALVDDKDFAKVSKRHWIITNRNHTNYVYSHIVKNGNKTGVYLHRFIMDAPAGREVDHINGDGLDNRRCNLRLCTRLQNMQNKSKKVGKRLKGTIWHKQRSCWVAQIRFGGKLNHLGVFKEEEDAAIAYDVASQVLFGSFANNNLVNAA